jgi:cytochrome b pre-mRNA-processing protein 3
MSFFSKLFGTGPDPREAVRPLWHKVVELARDPAWYSQCKVADEVDGRFDMITAVLSTVAVRLETANLHSESALLCEFFVEDMDGQLREFGINDVVVGKHMGRLMSTLGGRLGAYRPALLDGDVVKLEAAIGRNVSFAEGGSPAGVAARLQALHNHLATLDETALLGADFGVAEGV